MFISNNSDTWPLLLKREDVQKITGFSKGKVLKLIQDGNLPMVRLRGGYVINRDAMIKWLAQFKGE